VTVVWKPSSLLIWSNLVESYGGVGSLPSDPMKCRGLYHEWGLVIKMIFQPKYYFLVTNAAASYS
jgi:Zn-dependent protease